VLVPVATERAQTKAVPEATAELVQKVPAVAAVWRHDTVQAGPVVHAKLY